MKLGVYHRVLKRSARLAACPGNRGGHCCCVLSLFVFFLEESMLMYGGGLVRVPGPVLGFIFGVVSRVSFVGRNANIVR